MKHRILSALTALACVCATSLPALAAFTGPVIAKAAGTNVQATPYSYVLFENVQERSSYSNTVYCSTGSLMLTADNGRIYQLTDLSQLADTDNFTLSLKTDVNPIYVKSIKAAPADRQNGDLPSYAIKLSENAVLDPIVLTFDAVFRARREVVLDVREVNTTSKQELTVKSSAKITLNHKLRVDYDELSKLAFRPKLDTDLNVSPSNSYPSGSAGEVLTPIRSGDSDITWMSGVSLVAEVNLNGGAMGVRPKLYTKWNDKILEKKFLGQEAFIRRFNTAVEDRVQLTLTNPYLGADGAETVPVKDIRIYRYQNGGLTDVTGNFSYKENSDGDGAFVANVSHLSTYIFSKGKVKTT